MGGGYERPAQNQAGLRRHRHYDPIAAADLWDRVRYRGIPSLSLERAELAFEDRKHRRVDIAGEKNRHVARRVVAGEERLHVGVRRGPQVLVFTDPGPA